MKRNIKSIRLIEYSLVFFISTVSRFFISMNVIPLNYLSDETSTISVAAFLAGYDWSEVVSRAGYYGIGYMWLFFPLFRTGLSAYDIYTLIAYASTVLLGFTGIICNSIIRTFYPEIGILKRVILSCLAGCLSIFNTYYYSALNESMLLLISWMILYFVIRIIDLKCKRDEVFLVITLLYSLTVHSRSVIFIIGLCLSSIIYWLKEKKSLLSRYFWYALAVFWLIINLSLKIYQSMIWTRGGIVRNTSALQSIITSINKIHFDIPQIKSYLMIFLGIVFSGTVLSLGLLLIAILSIIHFSYSYIISNSSNTKYDLGLIYSGIYYLICMVGIIVGQCFTWSSGVYEAIKNNSTEWVDSFRSFSYLRYSGPFAAPLIIIGMIVLIKNIEKSRGVVLGAYISLCALLLFWITNIMPYVKEHRTDVFLSISILPKEYNISEQDWFAGFIFLMIFTSICFVVIKSNNQFFYYYLIIVIVTTSVIRITAFNNNTLYNMEDNNKQVNSGTDLLQSLSEYISEDDIYIIENRKRFDHQNWYLYQYMNYNIHIVPGMPRNLNEGGLVLSNGLLETELLPEYKMYQLDDNEFLYYKGEKYETLLREVGIEEE